MAGKAKGAKVDKIAAESAETTRKCLELRLSGATLEGIARVVGIDKSNVSRRIKAALASIPEPEAKALRALENERLDAMQFAIWKQVREGHHAAIDRAIRISERRSRLNGLDAPQRVDLGARAVDIESVAREIMGAFEGDAPEVPEPEG